MLSFCFFATQLSNDTVQVLTHITELSWSPTRMINIDTASFTPESLYNSLVIEKKLKLNFIENVQQSEMITEEEANVYVSKRIWQPFTSKYIIVLFITIFNPI